MQQNFAGFISDRVVTVFMTAIHGHFTDVVALLLCAVILVWSFKRVGLPPILAYLLTGLVAAGYGLMDNSHEIHLIAEVGIVFLLFSLGLEFSIPKLMAMRSVVFGLGSTQVLLSILIGTFLVSLFGFGWSESLIIACIVSLSSTAVVVKIMKESGMLNLRKGQLSIGVLLFQDIAVVPMLIVFPLMASTDNQFLVGALVLALAKGAFVCLLLWAIGKWILPKVFNEVALARTDELFVLTTLVVALCAGALTYAFGLSMALGAFLAGMMLGESQYRHQLEAEIRPFRDILMGLFFVTVGMQLDVAYVISAFGYIVAAMAVLLLVKVTIVYFSAQMMGERKRDALASGIMLWQMGEFGFVLVALAGQHHLLTPDTASFLIALGVLSMAFTPYLMSETDRLLKLFKLDGEHKSDFTYAGFKDDTVKDHVVIFGYARVGQTIARFLKPEAIPYVAIERNPIIVQEAQTAGEPVIFGHAGQKAILKSACVNKARLVIVTMDDFEQSQIVIDALKHYAPEVKILVRMQDDTHLEDLKQLGVTEVVPESLEASLMLVSHVLYMSGVPMRRIFKRVSKERQNRYEYLHGFFTGSSDEMSEYGHSHSSSSFVTDRLEYLHAVALPEDAYAVEKTISQLQLVRQKVVVKALRRDGTEIPMPDEDIILQASDVLLLKGKPRRVERAEQFILDGLP
ncbi:potassium transporter [Pseudoalteromonas luteoviolacea CPMOR-1]|uniref:Potassium transporter n=2 Tax=Pseudoalteromonas luteoviolacea TaxID=43657 RepID=A0A167LTM6_9GAMM|nr:potassium transporter [Pseudoalteromonas luteoviolacea CPMOR-1]